MNPEGIMLKDKYHSFVEFKKQQQQINKEKKGQTEKTHFPIQRTNWQLPAGRWGKGLGEVHKWD